MLQGGLLTKESSDVTEPTLLGYSYSTRGLDWSERSEDNSCPPLMKQPISLTANDLSNDTNDTLISTTDESGNSQRTLFTPSLISLESVKPKQLPLSMYFILAIPAMLDLGATAFSIAGLVYLDVSIFQMISNSNIVFVALMKHFILKNLLYRFHWVGVFWIVVSVFIGGSSALLKSQISGNVTDGSGVTATDTLVGVVLVMAGAALFAVQTVMDEKLMKVDIPVPPLLLIGMQGLWGVVLSILVMFPMG
jgi:drug/metabolite transporter (DMT)-like permease